jgi:meso-butanediol dehydrogenase/(S,S)-butanediol dehydrogenase/diacetyl reductase
MVRIVHEAMDLGGGQAMTEGLSGRIALVTGAASGIGRATAERLAREGVKVVAGVADEGQRADLASSVPTFDALVLDVRSEDAWGRAVARIEERHGGLDILVNNAGIHRLASALETTRDIWDEVMEVNLWGTFLGCKAAIPAMRRRGRGAIVNLSSVNAIEGMPGMLAYAVSKGGIRTMTMAIAMEHVGDGIRVNCVCPGPIRTPITEGLATRAPNPEAMWMAMAARQPMHRVGEPEEVAAAITFLASDDASFMTGLSVPVTGGRGIH